MRETSGLPAGFLAYFAAMLSLLLLCQKIFVAPQEWPRLITFATSVISFQFACAAAEKFSTLTGVKIVAGFIAVFQMMILGADMLGLFSHVLKILEGIGNETPADLFVDFLASVWNSAICAGVTSILALWTVSK